MITVVGYDGGPMPALAGDRLRAASLVMGGRRHLVEVDLPDGVRTIALRDDPGAAIAAVADEMASVWAPPLAPACIEDELSTTPSEASAPDEESKRRIPSVPVVSLVRTRR